MQKVWDHLLSDEEFKEAYRHGILLECGDGIIRRLFPRFCTYAADYPEKYGFASATLSLSTMLTLTFRVLLAAMRHLAKCPCPRCLIKLNQISAAGTKIDYQRRAHKRVDTKPLQLTLKRVRRWIFEGANMAGKNIQAPLKDHSLFPIQVRSDATMLVCILTLNPTQSAFSKFLSEFNKNFYELFAPDLMHEFELGVWKGIFNHLLRLLCARGGGAVQQFNERYASSLTQLLPD